MNRIFWVLIIVVAVLFGAAWYSHRLKTHAMNSGEVTVRKQSGDTTRPLPDATAPSTQPDQSATASATGDQPVTQSQPLAVTPPVADSVPRNPPNGMVFAGAGKYQLYRQGDITWRLNTDSGDACILLATDSEWRKSQVYRHGCGAA